jgi:hypothetical protein
MIPCVSPHPRRPNLKALSAVQFVTHPSHGEGKTSEFSISAAAAFPLQSRPSNGARLKSLAGRRGSGIQLQRSTTFATETCEAGPDVGEPPRLFRWLHSPNNQTTNCPSWPAGSADVRYLVIMWAFNSGCRQLEHPIHRVPRGDVAGVASSVSSLHVQDQSLVQVIPLLSPPAPRSRKSLRRA